MSQSELICNAIRKAIKYNLFEYKFQPIYDSSKSEFTKAELLIRLNDNELGQLSPDIFIKVAEDNGLISDIGIMVLEEACKTISILSNKNIEFEDISINISSTQLEDVNFYKSILSAVERYKIDPTKLIIEITETENSSDIEKLKSVTEMISQVGIKLAIDDFGNGYNSFGRLIKIPLKYIKIDKSILWSADENYQARIILKHILNFAKDINLEVIAEGVEKNNHLSLLDGYGCRYMQGYYFSKPVNFSEIDEYFGYKG